MVSPKLNVELTVVTSSSSSKGGSSGISSGEIGGIVGGVLGAFLLLCIVVIFFLLRRRREKAETQNETVPVNGDDTEPVKIETAAAPLGDIPVSNVDSGNAEVGGRLRYPDEEIGGRLQYPNDEVELGGRLMSNP